jgi:Ig-like domain from next to BRCA1 gene
VFIDLCSKKIWIGVQSASGGWSRADLLSVSFNVSTFGEDSTGEIYVADVFGGAIYRLARVPYGGMYQASAFSITTGATLTVPVTLTNTGSLTWNPTTFHLAYHWYQGATLVTWPGVRSVPPAPVPPGGSVTLQAAVVAPATAGAYTLRWDMVQESVTWFSAQGVTPMAVPVSPSPPLHRLTALGIRHRPSTSRLARPAPSRSP